MLVEDHDTNNLGKEFEVLLYAAKKSSKKLLEIVEHGFEKLNKYEFQAQRSGAPVINSLVKYSSTQKNILTEANCAICSL